MAPSGEHGRAKGGEGHWWGGSALKTTNSRDADTTTLKRQTAKTLHTARALTERRVAHQGSNQLVLLCLGSVSMRPALRIRTTPVSVRRAACRTNCF